MLPRRLSLVAATGAAALLFGACAGVDGSDDGVVRENVIEPGLTAIADATPAACSAEASSFRAALDAYDVLHGEPAPDEKALIDDGMLRSESDLWDVVDGELVAQDPGCGDAATTVPAATIVADE